MIKLNSKCIVKLKCLLCILRLFKQAVVACFSLFLLIVYRYLLSAILENANNVYRCASKAELVILPLVCSDDMIGVRL